MAKSTRRGAGWRETKVYAPKGRVVVEYKSTRTALDVWQDGGDTVITVHTKPWPKQPAPETQVASPEPAR